MATHHWRELAAIAETLAVIRGPGNVYALRSARRGVGEMQGRRVEAEGAVDRALELNRYAPIWPVYGPAQVHCGPVGAGVRVRSQRPGDKARAVSLLDYDGHFN